MSFKQQKLVSENQFASNIFWPNFAIYATDRRIVSQYFINIPSHWLFLLLPFESSSPEKYYDENVFEIVSELLADAFDNDLSYFEKSLSYFANELDSAYTSYQRATQLICEMPIPEIGRELRLRQYVFPTYQELIEAVWRPLARFCVMALEKPSETDFEKYSNYGIKEIESKLSNRHSKFELLSGFDRVVRNNIAHHKFEFSDDVMKQDVIVLHDPREQDISDDEIDILLTDLYDNCSAILYGILRYGALNERRLTVVPFGHHIRSQVVKHAIQDRRIHIEKNTFVETNAGRQRNLEIRYNYPCDVRVLMFAFSVLKLAVRFLPSDSYFITVKPKKGMHYIWIRTEHHLAQSFLQDKLSLADYLKASDTQILRKWDELTRKPKLPTIFGFLPSLLPNLISVITREIRYYKGWSVIDERNFSTGVNGRYEVYLVQHRSFSQEEIRRIIRKVIHKKRALFKHLFLAIWDIIRNIVKKTRVRSTVNVVIVQLWEKDKRISQMSFSPNQGHPLCVCCAEWNRTGSFLWLQPSGQDEKVGDEIVIRWF